MRRFFARCANLFMGRRSERELSREIASHLGLLQEEFERRGMTPEEAKLAARRTYGGVEQAKELHREARSFLWIEHLSKDLRYAGRNVWRTPDFILAAVLTLALGVGANTAIFSVVDTVLLRPLGYKDSDRLVTLLHSGTGPVAPANYLDWRDQSHSFEALAAAEYWTPNLTGIDSPEHLTGLHVTENLLPMLGIQPLRGRLFAAGEDRKGAEHEVILSNRLWLRRFDRDPQAIGRLIMLDGESYTVIGVMPAEFQFAPFWATRAELWAPLALGDRAHDRDGNSLRVFARLRPGIPLTQARADIGTVTARLEREYPGTNRGVVVTPLKENVVGSIKAPLMVMLAAVGFVLLMACGNVAHMLLARTSDRQKEIAVRTALGAGRTRVIAQFLTESFLLAMLGAAAGVLLAFCGIKALVAARPAYLPRVEMTSIDGRVLLFLLGITVTTVVLFGLSPALRAAAGDGSSALKENGRGDSDGRHRNRLRSWLVASEFALAFILLIGAGLTVRSFFALESLDPGFNPHNVLSMVVSVQGSKEEAAGRRSVFYRELLKRVQGLPGVESARAINHLPLAGDMWGQSFSIEGRPKPRPGESPAEVYRIVMPGYFETMRLRLLRGRSITEKDDIRAPGVVVINQRAARQYWPGEDPIGRRIAVDQAKGSPIWLTIVGIAADAKQLDWAATPEPEIYLSALQNRDFLGEGDSHMAYITLVVRATGNPATLAPAVKRTVWSFDPNLPISDVLTMDEAVASANAQPRFEMFLMGTFAAVAFMLAAAGIYGVMNYSVSRRTREIGIRISLGASRAHVLRLVARGSLAQALAGSAAGVAGALLLSRLMNSILYGVRTTDPLTFSAAAVLLGPAALLATAIPARKATRIEPAAALRNE